MVGEDDQGDPTWFIGHLEQFKFKAVIGNSRKILISRTCPSFKDSNEKTRPKVYRCDRSAAITAIGFEDSFFDSKNLNLL